MRFLKRLWRVFVGSPDVGEGEPADAFYRNYRITKNPYGYLADPYIFSHADYYGPGDNRCGTARTIEEAKVEIDAIEADIERIIRMDWDD